MAGVRRREKECTAEGTEGHGGSGEFGGDVFTTEDTEKSLRKEGGHHGGSGEFVVACACLAAQTALGREGATQDPPSKNEDGAPGLMEWGEEKYGSEDPQPHGVARRDDGRGIPRKGAMENITSLRRLRSEWKVEPRTHPQKTRMGHPA
jgi:hypothetical protein